MIFILFLYLFWMGLVRPRNGAKWGQFSPLSWLDSGPRVVQQFSTTMLHDRIFVKYNGSPALGLAVSVTVTVIVADAVTVEDRSRARESTYSCHPLIYIDSLMSTRRSGGLRGTSLACRGRGGGAKFYQPACRGLWPLLAAGVESSRHCLHCQ